MIKDYIEKHQNNAILAAIVTSALAFGGTLLSAGLTYHYSNQSQDRQVKLEQVSKFDASSSELVAAGGAFINAINDNKDLEAARKKLSSVVATQIYNSEDLKRAYGGDVSRIVKEYQSALTDLNQTSRQTSSVTEMRVWAETFGRVLDTKAALSDEIYDSLGTQKRRS